MGKKAIIVYSKEGGWRGSFEGKEVAETKSIKRKELKEEKGVIRDEKKRKVSVEDQEEKIEKSVKKGVEKKKSVEKAVEKKKGVEKAVDKKCVEKTVEKKKCAEKAVEREFIVHCRPQGVYQVLQSLNEKQKEDIRSIGFGGLLTLELGKYIPVHLMRWLTSNFNGISRMLTIGPQKSFVVTANDICDIFLLPRTGERVVEVGKNQKSIVLGSLSRLNIDLKTSVSKLGSLLIDSLKEGGADFKRVFTLYSLSTFLTPTTNGSVDFNAYNSIVDVDRICQFDWCSYILKKLCTAVDSYNRNMSQKNVSGCVICLQILYFHRMKWQGEVEPCTLPLLQHWTTEKLRKRMKEEAMAGKYGQGEWVDGYPISDGKNVGEKEHSAHVHEDKMAAEKEEEIVEEVDEEIKFNVPKGELTASKIKEMCKDDVVQMTLVLLKRDISIVSNFHMSTLLKFMDKSSSKESDPICSDSSASDSQQFFEDPKVQKCIDEIVDNFLAMKKKKVVDDMPSFELLTPSPIKDDDDDDDDDEHLKDEEIEKVISSSSKKNHEDKETTTEADDMILLGEDVGFFCTFLKKNKTLFSTVEREKKEVIDYCFYHTEKSLKSELLFRNGNTTISYEEVQSLNSFEQIYTCVIDAWAKILNVSDRLGNQQKCFFFDTGHSFYLKRILDDLRIECNEKSVRECWKRWCTFNNVILDKFDMFFVPIQIQNHYIGAVLNLLDLKMHYLDNRKHVDPEIYIYAVEEVQKQLSVFLEEMNHPKADLVAKCVLENIEFSWQKKNSKDQDCGVFLMNHMECFDGKVYTCPDLGKALIRRLLRGEYLVRILLHNINELKADVIKKVSEFSLKKPQLVEICGKKKKD